MDSEAVRFLRLTKNINQLVWEAVSSVSCKALPFLIIGRGCLVWLQAPVLIRFLCRNPFGLTDNSINRNWGSYSWGYSHSLHWIQLIQSHDLFSLWFCCGDSLLIKLFCRKSIFSRHLHHCFTCLCNLQTSCCVHFEYSAVTCCFQASLVITWDIFLKDQP